jgi:hypothetical protein
MLVVRNEQMDAITPAAGRSVITCDLTWVEFELLDIDGNPVPSVAYQVTLPDGSMRNGTLDNQGMVRFDNIDPGQCEITFTDIDGREWQPI